MIFFNGLAKLLFKLMGWQLEGKMPPYSKAIFTVCPHNTWLDLVIGFGVRPLMNKNISYLGKAELFNGAFKSFFYATGGRPLVRQKNQNQVDAVADMFKNSEDCLIGMSPEGTRKSIQKLRTGFYYIALKADIPIVMVGFDFDRKRVLIGPDFKPSGNFQVDMQQYFVPFYKTISRQKDWIGNYEEGKFDV